MHLDPNSLSYGFQLVYQLTELPDRSDTSYASSFDSDYGFPDTEEGFRQSRQSPGGFPRKRQSRGNALLQKVDLEQ